MLGVAKAGNAGVVGTVVDDPTALVEPALTLEGHAEVAVRLRACDSVDRGEMLQQPSLGGPVVDGSDVFNVVAVGAKGLEAGEPLATGLLGVLPDLVAVQSGLPTACLTAELRLAIRCAADYIPLLRRQHLGEAGQPGTGGNGLDDQTQGRHDQGIWRRRLISTERTPQGTKHQAMPCALPPASQVSMLASPPGLAQAAHKGVGSGGQCALAGTAIMAAFAQSRPDVMPVAQKCWICGSGEGIRSLCPRSGGRVTCRDCCIVEPSLDGHSLPVVGAMRRDQRGSMGVVMRSQKLGRSLGPPSLGGLANGVRPVAGVRLAQAVPHEAITHASRPELAHSAFRPSAAGEQAIRQMARSGPSAAEVIAMKGTAKEDRTPMALALPPKYVQTTSPRRLPTVQIRGRQCFRDDRLEEFRAVDDPFDRIPFEVMCWALVVLGKWPA